MNGTDELDMHMRMFRRAYEQYNPAAPEEQRLAWAHHVADTPRLWSLPQYADVWSGWPSRFEPGSYLNDDGTKK